MTATKSEIIKRRRISSSFSDPPPQTIRDLAVEPLTHVANFLSTPSRAMFALALSSDLSHFIWDEENQPSTIWWIDSGRGLDKFDNISLSSAQIAGKCDNLDFDDIEEDLAVRLNDNHIDEILLCLDRDDNRIKKLRLTNCINITGEGLKRLRWSSTIEQIDLSMVPDHEKSTSWSRSRGRLEFSHVVGILDSIVSLQQLSSLKYLHFPWYWRSHASRDDSRDWRERPIQPEIKAFMERYKQMWGKRTTFCAHCTCQFEPLICQRTQNSVNMQSNTCSICMKHYCLECDGANGKQLIAVCERCERAHCQDCVTMEECGACDAWFCQDRCGGSEVWEKYHGNHYEGCSGCDRKVCGSCCFERTCWRCGETDCGNCRLEHVPTWTSRGLGFVDFRYVEECEICDLSWCRRCCEYWEHGWEFCDDCDLLVICHECVPGRTCHACDKSFCNRCRSIAECKRCNKNWCSDCDSSRAWGRDGRGGYCIDCAEA